MSCENINTSAVAINFSEASRVPPPRRTAPMPEASAPVLDQDVNENQPLLANVQSQTFFGRNRAVIQKVCVYSGLSSGVLAGLSFIATLIGISVVSENNLPSDVAVIPAYLCGGFMGFMALSGLLMCAVSKGEEGRAEQKRPAEIII